MTRYHLSILIISRDHTIVQYQLDLQLYVYVDTAVGDLYKTTMFHDLLTILLSIIYLPTM